MVHSSPKFTSRGGFYSTQTGHSQGHLAANRKYSRSNTVRPFGSPVPRTESGPPHLDRPKQCEWPQSTTLLPSLPWRYRRWTSPQIDRHHQDHAAPNDVEFAFWVGIRGLGWNSRFPPDGGWNPGKSAGNHEKAWNLRKRRGRRYHLCRGISRRAVVCGSSSS